MGFFKDPDGNTIVLHRRYAPVAREQLLERYRELPLPTTKDESWRFTDLRGLIPTFTAEGAGSAPERLLDIGVSGLVTVTESELTIDRAPEGVIFERLDESHRGCTSWSAGRRSSQRTTRRCGRTACWSSCRGAWCWRPRCT